jgi:LCP family protein required for cell wall assembly
MNSRKRRIVDPNRHEQAVLAPQAGLEDDRLSAAARTVRVVGGVVTVILLSGLAYLIYLVFSVAGISKQPFSLSSLGEDANGRTNILILGEGDTGHAGEGLTDTMMIMSVQRRTHQVAQISIPRDLRVVIPGYGYGKINSANANGGVVLAERTVSDTFGLPIHGYISTNFSGISAIVDAVGGIDVNVTGPLIDPEYPCDDNQYKPCGLNIQPGLQHMTGARVLQYTRCRKGTCGNDFGRAARQQEVLGLLREKTIRWQTLINPSKLTPLARALRVSLSTDLDALQLFNLGYDWQKAGQSRTIHLVLSTSPGGYLKSYGSTSDLVPIDGTFSQASARIQNIFTGQ